MRNWIPISTSSKGRLVLAAVVEFGRRPFDDVTVGDLAAEASVTTGVLYHHFGSKLGLYTFVREDVEQRLLDRMEGAIAAAGGQITRSEAVQSALLVGFDFAVKEGFLHILGTPPVGSERDRLADMLGANVGESSPILGGMIAAAWRVALAAVSAGADPDEVRIALASLEYRVPQ